MKISINIVTYPGWYNCGVMVLHVTEWHEQGFQNTTSYSTAWPVGILHVIGYM